MLRARLYQQTVFKYSSFIFVFVGYVFILTPSHPNTVREEACVTQTQIFVTSK